MPTPDDSQANNLATDNSANITGDNSKVSTGIIWLHEIVATIVGLTITYVTLRLMWICFHLGSTVVTTDTGLVNAYNREKDILQLGLTLLGTIIGYYFGRNPLEKQVQQAQQTVDKTQDRLSDQQQKTGDAVAQAKQAQQQTDSVKAQVVQELTRMTAGPTPGGPAPAPPSPADLQVRLLALLDRVNQIA